MIFKDFRSILEALSSEGLEIYLKILNRYAKKKYGPKAEICKVWTDEKRLTFQTPATTGTVDILSDNLSSLVRNMVGQNIMVRNGLPGENGEPTHVILFIYPSLIKELGLIKANKFIND